MNGLTGYGKVKNVQVGDSYVDIELKNGSKIAIDIDFDNYSFTVEHVSAKKKEREQTATN